MCLGPLDELGQLRGLGGGRRAGRRWAGGILGRVGVDGDSVWAARDQEVRQLQAALF